MALPDIYTEGIASGWKVIDAARLAAPQTMEADVAIVGSGAGGGVAAEVLALAGLKVLLLEEGALRTSDSFRDMDEARAYRELYQEGGARATSDGAIAVMQGRSVGGSTTVNWTSSFRTPKQTLEHWAAQHEVKGHGVAEMQPWFEQMERRLDVCGGRRTTPTTTCSSWAAKARLGGARHPAQRARLLELGLLRLRLPGQCQAVDAGVHHPRGAAATAPRWCTGCACASCSMPTAASPARWARRCAPTASPQRHAGDDPGAALHRRRRRNQHAGAAAALGPARPAPAPGQAHADPSGGAVDRADARAHRRLLWRAAIDRLDHFQWKDGATGPMGYKLEVPPMFPGITSGVLNRVGNDLRK